MGRKESDEKVINGGIFNGLKKDTERKRFYKMVYKHTARNPGWDFNIYGGWK